MQVILSVYLFLIGAAMGSFAGAVAWRLAKGRDFVRERSECEYCHHTLAWYDLVPVLSWLFLKGRCRYCRRPIGVSLLWLELGLGAAFLASLLLWPYGWTVFGVVLFILWLLSLVILTILFIYDLKHSLLPDVLVWPLVAVGFVMFGLLMVLQDVSLARWPLEAGLALLPISGVYSALYMVSKGAWIGLGDVKLGLFIGLVLGWQGGLVALLLANYLGFFWVLPALIRGKLDRKAHMPFGPFLIVATFVVFLQGQVLIDWAKYILAI